MRRLGFFLWAIMAVSGSAAAAELGERDRAAIEALEQRVFGLPGPNWKSPPAPLTQRMAESRVPAVSVAMIENGRVKWARAYGEAEAGSGRRATPATRFQAASLSKPVAAAGALRLVQRGRLALDEDLGARLAAWGVATASPGGAGGVTLRRLLSHTAGISVAGYPGYRRGEAVPTLLQAIRGVAPARTARLRQFAPPGKQVAYSGGGYSLAQMLMVERGRRDFGPLMERLVLKPAGMTRSTFDQALPGRAGGDAASGHDGEGALIAGGSLVYPELAAAGLWTTPSDYGRFAIALQRSWTGRGRALLKPDIARAMGTPVLADYGLGLTVVERDGRRAISHGGANEGFQCRFVAFLDGAGEGLVVMTNGDNGGALAAAIQRTIGEAYRWVDTQGPPVPRAPDR
jgi:CubicO group peptidase (beta-lactamase class C family)